MLLSALTGQRLPIRIWNFLLIWSCDKSSESSKQKFTVLDEDITSSMSCRLTAKLGSLSRKRQAILFSQIHAYMWITKKRIAMTSDAGQTVKATMESGWECCIFSRIAIFKAVQLAVHGTATARALLESRVKIYKIGLSRGSFLLSSLPMNGSRKEKRLRKFQWRSKNWPEDRLRESAWFFAEITSNLIVQQSLYYHEFGREWVYSMVEERRKAIKHPKWCGKTDFQ